MEDAYKSAVNELKKKSHYGGPDYEARRDGGWRECTRNGEMYRNPDVWISNLHNQRRARESELELLAVIKRRKGKEKKTEARRGSHLRFCQSPLAKQFLGAFNQSCGWTSVNRVASRTWLNTLKAALYIDTPCSKSRSILFFARGEHAFTAVNICISVKIVGHSMHRRL